MKMITQNKKDHFYVKLTGTYDYEQLAGLFIRFMEEFFESGQSKLLVDVQEMKYELDVSERIQFAWHIISYHRRHKNQYPAGFRSVWLVPPQVVKTRVAALLIARAGLPINPITSMDVALQTLGLGPTQNIKESGL